jgi:hypothetical protein
MKFASRLAKLEAATRNRRVVVIWHHQAETDELAKGAVANGASS